MTRTTSTSARLAALAVGGVLLAGCGDIESAVTPRPVAVAAAATPGVAGELGVALLREVEREITVRGKRAIRRSGAEFHFIDVSCAADDERQFTCATVARMRSGVHCETVESTQRGFVLSRGEHDWANMTVDERTNDSRLCP